MKKEPYCLRYKTNIFICCSWINVSVEMAVVGVVGLYLYAFCSSDFCYTLEFVKTGCCVCVTVELTQSFLFFVFVSRKIYDMGVRRVTTLFMYNIIHKSIVSTIF